MHAKEAVESCMTPGTTWAQLAGIIEKDKHVLISPSAAFRLHNGQLLGYRMDRKFERASVLEQGAAQKDSFYKLIALTGISLRKYVRYLRLSSRGFMEGLAEVLGTDPQKIRRCFRAMRTDLVYTELEHEKKSLNPDLPESLIPSIIYIAETYLSDYAKGPEIPPTIRVVNQEWDRTTFRGFYRLFNEHVKHPATVGTWPPYEVGVFNIFYSWRLSIGNPPTPFDKLCLEAGMENRLPKFTTDSREDALTTFDRFVTQTHTNVMLFGRPKVPTRA